MYSKMKYIVLAVIFLLIVVGALVMFKLYQRNISQMKEEIESLEQQISTEEERVVIYRLAVDVKSGNECFNYELEPFEVPVSVVSDNNIFSDTDIIGKYYKLNLQKGTWLVRDVFEEYKISKDMRMMDVVFDELPIGLQKGDYIDVRIAFPLGQDYIALSHKRVEGINGSTVKLIVEQKDFYTYESMKTDLATYRSTKVYGVQYIEAGIQEAATTYYPVNLEVLETMLLDPNMSTADYSTVLTLRKKLGEQLHNSERVDIADTVTSGREAISQKFIEAEQLYSKLQEDKERIAEAERRKTEAGNN